MSVPNFFRSINNFFNIYEPMLDSWTLFDNSRARPEVIAKQRNGHIEIIEDVVYQAIQNSVR